MDPFAALGLAGNIVQFLEFSGKLISGASDLYRSADGSTATNRALESIYSDLEQLCAGLVPASKGESKSIRTKSETSLQPLLESCQKLGGEFLAVLEDLKVQGRRRGWQSVRQALRSVWKASEIQWYEKQLGAYRAQIATRILTMLTEKQHYMAGRQSGLYERLISVGDALDRLAERHRVLEVNLTEQATSLRDDIVASLTSVLEVCVGLPYCIGLLLYAVFADNEAVDLSHDAFLFALQNANDLIQYLEIKKVFYWIDHFKQNRWRNHSSH